MKNKISVLLFGLFFFCPLCITVQAEPPAPKEKPADKKKEEPKKDANKDPKKDQKPEPEATSMLDRFLTNTPYSREETKKLKSPFINLIVVEKIKKAAEDEAEKLRKNTEALIGIEKDPTNPTDTKDDQIRRILTIQAIQKGLEVVAQLVESRKFELAEEKLVVLDQTRMKNNIEELREIISKKKIEVAAERKDWEEINKIINTLSVDAMFIAEGKKKVALINDIAVEEGDDLNDLLSLAKDSPIILTFVSSNSLKIKYKKFTLQKELIDNDL